MLKLCKKFSLEQPNSHYNKARKSYLEVIKRKKKSKKLINKGKLELLAYLSKDIHSIVNLIAVNGTQLLYNLKSNEQRLIGSIIKMHHQQDQMFKNKVNTCSNRIISIFQPHIRPIVRGKAKSLTEFGAKIGASIVKGFTFIDHHSWDAYNESSDLELQIQLYKERFGYLPAKLYADKIYLNKANRLLLKLYQIEIMGTPLGRPSKESKTDEFQAKQAKIAGERNEIEATFGTAKRVYKANNIRAKLPETANSWTGMCYLVKNVMEFLRKLLLVHFFVIWISKNFCVFRSIIQAIRIRPIWAF